MNKRYPTVLTIAGSDCSGGAGIQADIKTITANGGYAASVITALTAQNTLGVQQIQNLPQTFIDAQLHSVFSDITVDAVKIGMLHDEKVINSVKKAIACYKPSFTVLDPVMIAKGGAKLIKENVIDQLKNSLFPLVTLITPNVPEAETLLQQAITSKNEMAAAAKELSSLYKVNVLIKGGHLNREHCCDVLHLWENKTDHWFSSLRIQTKNTHGTGCSLSSAIATFLARKYSLISAIRHAKRYISEAIAAGKDYKTGHGHGPIYHYFREDYDV